MPRKLKSSGRGPVSETEIDVVERTLAAGASDPKLVEGIFNYCDRWCERCPMTTRCLSYKLEHARRARRKSDGVTRDDTENAAFWDDVATSLGFAMRLIRREARRRGIDLDAPDAIAEAKREERQRRRQAAQQGSALHRAANDYTGAARALRKELTPELAATETALQTQARLGAGDPHAVAAGIRDALEVVAWYQFFIDVKLQRAVASRVDHQPEGDDGFPSDADGSAKIALIAIDRSIGAWVRLRPEFPAQSDAIIELLVRLERLRRAVENEFPQARAFKRPGFD